MALAILNGRKSRENIKGKESKKIEKLKPTPTLKPINKTNSKLNYKKYHETIYCKRHM